MKQIGLAVANYHSDYGTYPPAFIADAAGKPRHSWRVLILPYLGEQELHEQYDFAKSWDSPSNARLANEMPATYAFHGSYEEGKTNVTNYLAITEGATAWPPSKTIIGQALPASEEQLSALVAENLGAGVHWMEPRDFQLDRMDLTINAAGGIGSKYDAPAVLMTDGTLTKLDPGTKPTDLLLFLKGKSQGAAATPLADGRNRPPRSLD